MNTKTSNRIIAAGGMATVIALGVALFFMRSTPVAPVARVDAPAAPVAEAPAADSEAVAQLPATPVPAAEVPAAAPAAVPNDTSTRKESQRSVPAVAEGKPSRHRDSASSSSQADASSHAIAPTEPVAAAADKSTMSASAPTVDTETAASEKAPASDSQITSEVKSAIASEGIANESSIDVTTTDGVVALSGSVPSQAAIEQVKDVAAKVKDVKRVDTSGLVASL